MVFVEKVKSGFYTDLWLYSYGISFHPVFYEHFPSYFFKISETGREETGDIDDVHFSIPGSRNFTRLS
jgi:hypothetical protein